MQGAQGDDDLRATFYCKDPDSQGHNDCETFYRTDLTSWLVQGKRRGTQVQAQLVSLADDETFCEISDRTMALFVQKYVKEHHGIDLSRETGGTDG